LIYAAQDRRPRIAALNYLLCHKIFLLSWSR
jgi:hypothetical protein